MVLSSSTAMLIHDVTLNKASDWLPEPSTRRRRKEELANRLPRLQLIVNVNKQGRDSNILGDNGMQYFFLGI